MGTIDWFIASPVGASVAVPKLWLAQGLGGPTIEWQAKLDHWALLDGNLLAEFVKLAEAEPETVAEFARQWGILGLDDNYRPILRDGSSPELAFDVPGDSPGQAQARYREWVTDPVRMRFQEPVRVWSSYAQQFRALLRVVADLQDERQPNDDDVENIWVLARMFPDPGDAAIGTEGGGERSSSSRGAETVSTELAASDGEAVAVTRLAIVRLIAALPLRYDVEIDASGVGRSMLSLLKSASVPQDKPYLAFLFPGPSLFAMLAVRLVAAVTSQFGLLRCSRCGNPYPRPVHRAPETTRRHFCSDTCRHEAKKEVNRAIARRRYAARRAASEGPGRHNEGA